MGEIITLDDSNWQQVADQAALVLFSNGEGIRSDFITQFKKSAHEKKKILFAQLDPSKNPQIAAAFALGEKPVMVALYKGEVLSRRQKPWGTDVVLAIELLESKITEDVSVQSKEDTSNKQEKPIVAENKPHHVTDQTFQTDVIDYSSELPVLVDFWAEWCGPCRMVAPIMEKLAEDFAGQVRVAKVDTDANPGLSQAFQIRSIPTIMAFKEGKLVFNQPGAFPEAAFRDLVQQLIDLEIPEDDAEGEPQQ
nr:thioredoxin [Phototrophicus methaneseepsis]